MSGSDSNMPFLDHLEELRRVLLRTLTLPALLFPLMFYLSPFLVESLLRHGGGKVELSYFSPMEPLWVNMKIALFAALSASAPFLAWNLWRFIAPGLRHHERRSALIFSTASSLLFLAGALFAGMFILPLLLDFSMSMQSANVKPVLGLENFVGMAGMLLLGFGLMAQCPLLVFILVRGGIVDANTLRRHRPLIIIVILVVSAVLTPPDAISQLLMAIPAWLMFEVGLLLAAAGRGKEESSIMEKVEDEDIKIPDTSITDMRQRGIYPKNNSSRKLRYCGTGKIKNRKQK